MDSGEEGERLTSTNCEPVATTARVASYKSIAGDPLYPRMHSNCSSLSELFVCILVYLTVSENTDVGLRTILLICGLSTDLTMANVESEKVERERK